MTSHAAPPLSPETEARIARSRIRWYRTIGITSIITCVVVLLALAGLYDNSRTARQQRDALAVVAHQIAECTTAPENRTPPEHPNHLAITDCYLRQQAAQAHIIGAPVGPINAVTVAAAACGARHPGKVAATRRCVEAALDAATP